MSALNIMLLDFPQAQPGQPRQRSSSDSSGNRTIEHHTVSFYDLIPTELHVHIKLIGD